MTVQTSTELSAISAEFTNGAIDVRRFVEQSTRMLSRLVDCDRAGVWCVSGHAPDRTLHCVTIFDRPMGRHTRVEDMREPQITSYVDAVIVAGTLESVDVRADPATKAIFESGGLHNGVTSVMAKTSWLNGELLCILTCAQLSGNVSFNSKRLAALQMFSSEFVLAIARNCHPPRAVLCGMPPPDDWDKAC